MKQMTRELMLKALSDLPFALIWPGNWEDIGFTEREIWVNNEGYGYISFDEPTSYWEGNGLTEDEWANIKEKLIAETLEYADIQGTALEELLTDFWDDSYDFDDQECLISDLEGLLSLQNGPCNYFYSMMTISGLEFFETENEFKSAYERDWADVSWGEIADDLLAEWIDRLSIEDDENLHAWVLRHGFQDEEVDETPQDIKETNEYKCWWNAHNSKEFTFCCTTVVYEGTKKRYVSLTATGENRVPGKLLLQPKTVFQVISTRQETIERFIISGIPEKGEAIVSEKDLGKWASVKDHMYPHLIDKIIRIAGHDPYAQSLDLFLSIKKALNTNVLDDLIAKKQCYNQE